MAKWKYKVLFIQSESGGHGRPNAWVVEGSSSEWSTLTAVLDAFGDAGWELVNVTEGLIGGSSVGYYRAFFQAPA